MPGLAHKRVHRAQEEEPASPRPRHGELRPRTSPGRLAAKISSLAALLAAVVLEWMLVNVPISEVSGQFPAAVRAGEEFITFTAPSSVTGDPFSFAYAPETLKEKIFLDAFFDDAQLSDQTLQSLRSLQVAAPASPGLISYLTSGAGDASCGTNLQVEPANGNFKSVEFSQSDSDISGRYRTLGVRFNGADALVSLTSQGGLLDGWSSCRVALSVGDWKQHAQGFLRIQIRVPPAAPFRLHWQNLDVAATTWDDNSAALRLLVFGSARSNEFLTQDIAIRSLNPRTRAPEDPPRLEFRAGDPTLLGRVKRMISPAPARGSPQSSLKVASFAVKQNQLEVTAAGKGSAQNRGRMVRVNVMNRINDYPIPSTLFGLANLALLGWVKRAFFPSRRKPSEEGSV